jgi:type IV pilus assembly protein PilN
MIKINLLAESKRPAAVRKAKAGIKPEKPGANLAPLMLLVGIVLGLAALGVHWWRLDGLLKDKKAEVAATEAEVKRLESVIKEVEEFKAKKAELEQKISVINGLKANQRGPVRMMDHISRALPELLWLERMKMGGTTIEVEGFAFNTNVVASFIENLDKVPEFDEPTLKDTNAQPNGVYKFVVSFTYSFAPKPVPGEATAGSQPGEQPKTSAPAGAATSG